MPAITEQTTTTKVKWWSAITTNMQAVVMIGGAVVGVVLFVAKVKNHDAEIQAIQVEQARHEEQVKKDTEKRDADQQVQDDKFEQQIEEIADWMHEQKGYQKALQETKK
jgi:hypothetical protein